MHLEKFSLKFSSSSFAIRVNLRHPYPSSFLFGLFLPLWHLTTLAKNYFKVLLYLKAILHNAKNDSKYRDVAPMTSYGKAFHSVGDTTEKDLAPCVFKLRSVNSFAMSRRETLSVLSL